jgi:hypothetical protein
MHLWHHLPQHSSRLRYQPKLASMAAAQAAKRSVDLRRCKAAAHDGLPVQLSL